jgi:hypothetical protein
MLRIQLLFIFPSFQDGSYEPIENDSLTSTNATSTALEQKSEANPNRKNNTPVVFFILRMQCPFLGNQWPVSLLRGGAELISTALSQA